jgi:hypothetical protein
MNTSGYGSESCGGIRHAIAESAVGDVRSAHFPGQARQGDWVGKVSRLQFLPELDLML